MLKSPTAILSHQLFKFHGKWENTGQQYKSCIQPYTRKLSSHRYFAFILEEGSGITSTILSRSTSILVLLFTVITITGYLIISSGSDCTLSPCFVILVLKQEIIVNVNHTILINSFPITKDFYRFHSHTKKSRLTLYNFLLSLTPSQST